MRPEIPVWNVEVYDEIMRRPIRYRQLAFWDWQLPEDESLVVYEANLRALGKTREAKMRAAAIARHLARYGHEADYDRHGKCRECTRLRVAKRYREQHGIPLDAPLATPGVTRRRLCRHNHRGQRDAWRNCIECRREAQRRYVAGEERKAAKREYDRARYLARKEQAA